MKYGVVSVILTVLAGTGMAAPSRQQGMTTAEATREIGTLQSLAQGNMKLTQAEATELDSLLKSFVGNLHQRDVQAGPLDGATGAVGGALDGVTGEVGKVLGGLDLGDLGKTLGGLLSGSGGDAKSKRDVQAGPIDAATGAVGGALNGATGAATGALNGVTGEVGKVLGGLDLGDLGKTLTGALGPLLSSLQKAKPLNTRSTDANPVDAATGAVGGALNGATGAVNGLTGALGNTLGGLLGGKGGLDLSSLLSSLTGNNKEVVEGLMKMGVTQNDVNMAVQHYNKQIAPVHKRSTEAGPLDAATGAVGGALNGATDAATDALSGATNTVGNALSGVTGLLGSLTHGGLDLGSILGSLTGNNKQVVEGLMKMGVTQNDVNIAVQHYAKMAQQEKRSVEASPVDGILDALKKSGISLDDITKFLQGPAGKKIQEALAGLMKTQGGAAVMDEAAAVKAGLNKNDIAVLNKFAQHTAHMAKRASPPQGGSASGASTAGGAPQGGSGSSDGAPDAAAPGGVDLSALLGALGKVTDNLPGGGQISGILKSLGPVLSSLGKQ